MTRIPLRIVELIQNRLVGMGHNIQCSFMNDWLTYDIVLDNLEFSLIFSSSKLNPRPEMPDVLSISPSSEIARYSGEYKNIYFDFSKCALDQYEVYANSIAIQVAVEISNMELASLMVI